MLIFFTLASEKVPENGKCEKENSKIFFEILTETKNLLETPGKTFWSKRTIPDVRSEAR